MLGRIIALTVLLVGCADPKYETVVNAGASGGSEKLGECALKFSGSGLCAQWEWEKPANTTADSALRFKIVRANMLDGTPLAVDQNVQVILWMPEMGHGSAPTKLERVDTGSYRVTEMYFIMPGRWQVRFQVKEGEAVKDEAVLELTL